MASKKIVKLLNDQVVLEAESSQVYLAMAVWADLAGFKGTSKFMFAQAEEERGHMFKIMKFLIELGEVPVVQALEEPKAQYKDIEEVFRDSLKHEQKVTASIHNIASEACEAGDHPVGVFLQWFVNEQVEEEAAIRQVLDIIKLAGKVSLYLADKEIGALRGAK